MTKAYKTPASAFGGATWWRQHCGGGPPADVQASRWGKRMTCTDCEPAAVAWRDEGTWSPNVTRVMVLRRGRYVVIERMAA